MEQDDLTKIIVHKKAGFFSELIPNSCPKPLFLTHYALESI